ncbi:MAG: V-type ATPase 116kDa subunit family protein [Ruminococcus sp.]|nr:V-type ATPase 116kDa subunit family protein [Ruminococcus sp.]
MAVSSMQAVNIIGLMEHIDEVITVLGESGVFHPDEVSVFYNNLRDFTHLQTKNIYAEPLTNLKAALNLTKRIFPLTDVSDFSPSFEELEGFSSVTTSEIDSLVEAREAAAAKLEEEKRNLSIAEHFAGLDVEIEQILKMKYMKAHFGKLPKDSMEKLEAYKDNKYVDFAVCTKDKTHCWGVYFTPLSKEDEIDRIFEGLYFEPAELVGENETPGERIEGYKKELPLLEKQVDEAQRNLDDYLDDNSEQITRYLSKLEELYLYSGIRSKAMQYHNSFIIVGWVPAENKKQIKKRLKKIRSVELDFADAKEEIDKRPPVKLKNCFLAKPFEFYTDMYGVPNYNEIDPTLFIAITYTIIFGIMFADIGQGICLSVIGMLMWKLKGMKIGRILTPCGISSVVFGTIFGSLFGFEHVLDPLYFAMGFKEKPIEVMTSKSIIVILLAAVAIGVLLVITAMCLNVYSSIKQGHIGRALFSANGVAGIVFYSALVFGMVAELMFNLHILTLPYILGLIVLPFLLIFFEEPLDGLIAKSPDWKPESWAGFIMEHIIESIMVLLEYVTNTVSFLRVGAFVLVHAGMMMVVFVLADTAGPVAYWPIVVFGNAFVMVLEALLVSIQVLRLEYYEMFSRFYSGEGRAFEPVRIIND